MNRIESRVATLVEATGGQQVYLTDMKRHLEIDMLTAFLTQMDAVLDAEGLSLMARDRILNAMTEVPDVSQLLEQSRARAVNLEGLS